MVTFYISVWFLDSVKAVNSDKAFGLPSEPARNAKETAAKLLAVSESVESQFSAFAEQLFILLGPVFASKPSKSLKVQREQMWSAYHSLRTSKTFIQKWASFLTSTIGEKQPNYILIQFLTDKFFHQMIRCQFPLCDVQMVPVQQQGLRYEERNALYYTAGAICCTLKKRLSEKSCEPSKSDLVIGINDLCCDDDEEEGEYDAKQWVKSVDRGGLCRVKEETYQLFYAMELFVRQHLSIQQADKLVNGSRAEIEKKLLEDEEVLFAWSIASVELDDKTGAILLKMIVDLWLTIRGFSFVGAFIEQYKNATKKGLQRSKALRKKVSQ